ncbi:MAG: septum formation initiator family protein [Gammaproteobacteria bacterium]|nr:septum formation initiator family protein [Gammaproteobacteria bacterium]
MKWLLAVLVVLLLTTQFRLWVGEGSLAEMVRLKRQLQQQQEQNTLLESRNRQLLREVRSMKEGTAGIEAKARNDLGMIKKGETLFVFFDPEESKRSEAVVTTKGNNSE